MLAIGIDLGGTRIKSVLIDEGGQVLQQAYTDTNDGDDRVWKAAVSQAVGHMKSHIGHREFVIGMSAPGLPTDDHGAIAFMPGRMQGLEGFYWNNFLGHPAYVLNDAVAALMAEARFGAAQQVKHAVLLTLGTGVGGAILVDGKPYQGVFNKAGHIGHMVVDYQGDPDVTGMPGSLEECIGNCTIEKRSGGLYTSTHDLLKAYEQGHEAARNVWLLSVRQLAIALASVTNILSPEVIVLGGGITQANELLFEPLQEYLEQYEWRAGGNRVRIVKAAFADLAGAIGAAGFALGKTG